MPTLTLVPRIKDKIKLKLNKKKSQKKLWFKLCKSDRLFEPTIMFFRLTNSPTTFQTLMSEILWDLINTGKVTSFIDNIIVGTQKEEHDEVVEEVVKRLVGNNLYVKLEKCK